MSLCKDCETAGAVVGVGSASGRLYYRCPLCSSQWQGKNPSAMALGALGGTARAKALSPERRRQIAIGARKVALDKKKE